MAKVKKHTTIKTVDAKACSKEFADAVENLGIPSTKRQWTKFQKQRGQAYRFHKYGEKV